MTDEEIDKILDEKDRGITCIHKEDYDRIMLEASKPIQEFKPNEHMVKAHRLAKLLFG